MATPSRIGLNNARHKSGLQSKQNEERRKREEELNSKREEVTEEEHEERLKKLKEIGLLK